MSVQDLSPDERQVASWKVFGKPNPEPYLLAAKVIADQATYLGWKKPSSGRPGYDIFMIGGETCQARTRLKAMMLTQRG